MSRVRVVSLYPFGRKYVLIKGPLYDPYRLNAIKMYCDALIIKSERTATWIMER